MRDGRESMVVRGSLSGVARDREGAGGTAAMATARAPGGVLWGTGRMTRMPIASPSYPRYLRYR